MKAIHPEVASGVGLAVGVGPAAKVEDGGFVEGGINV